MIGLTRRPFFIRGMIWMIVPGFFLGQILGPRFLFEKDDVRVFQTILYLKSPEFLPFRS